MRLKKEVLLTWKDLCELQHSDWNQNSSDTKHDSQKSSHRIIESSAMSAMCLFMNSVDSFYFH